MRMTKETEKITISVVGAGNRADIYLDELKKRYPNDFVINGFFDPNPKRKEYFKNKYNVKEENCFKGIDDFIKMDRISDVVIIATLDDMHFQPTIHALKKGYDIILEKPISMTLDETVAIGKVAENYPNQLVAVCHVLRHTPFFSTIKKIIDSKELGKPIVINHNENVGYYHYAHSYVRGNWRNTNISSPFIVAKSCHDMDIMLYLLGEKNSLRLSSMGDLNFFKPENKHYESEVADFPYDAEKIYSGDLIKSVVFNKTTSETLKEDLKNTNYGKSVFESDNNVADHQVTIIEFEGSVHASFTLSAFTNRNYRSIKVMCEFGEIIARQDINEIIVQPFGKEARTINPEKIASGHGGGDALFMINFMETYLNGKEFDSTLAKSIQSHVMAFAAEESRINKGKMIDIREFHNKNIELAKAKGLIE